MTIAKQKLSNRWNDFKQLYKTVPILNYKYIKLLRYLQVLTNLSFFFDTGNIIIANDAMQRRNGLPYIAFALI